MNAEFHEFLSKFPLEYTLKSAILEGSKVILEHLCSSGEALGFISYERNLSSFSETPAYAFDDSGNPMQMDIQILKDDKHSYKDDEEPGDEAMDVSPDAKSVIKLGVKSGTSKGSGGNRTSKGSGKTGPHVPGHGANFNTLGKGANNSQFKPYNFILHQLGHQKFTGLMNKLNVPNSLKNSVGKGFNTILKSTLKNKKD